MGHYLSEQKVMGDTKNFNDYLKETLSQEDIDSLEEEAEMDVEVLGASKNDKLDNKPDYSLLPKVFMDQVSFVMMAGAEKYGRYNYTKGHNMSQLLAAAERHLKAIQEGEDIDKDCSDRVGIDIHHAANVAANMLMLLHQLELSTIIDDRFNVKTKERK
jgi:hypothetical protein